MSSKTDRLDVAILVALVVVAVAVRLPGLNGGLWNDEIYSILNSFRTPFPEMFTTYPGDNKHPLYSHLAHLCIWLFGEKNWSVRLPAFLFGVATVPMLYVFARPIVGRLQAALAALLLGVSYHHAWFSQSARGYIILAFAAVLSTHLLLDALRTQNRRSALFYAIAVALAAYTHLTFVFAVFGQFAVALLAQFSPARGRQKPGWQAVLGPFAGAGLLTIVLYAPMLPAIREYFRTPSDMSTISSGTWALTETIRVLLTGLGDKLGLALVALIVAGFVGLAGFVSFLKRDRDIALLLTLPGLTVALGALAVNGALYPRFFFLLAGFLVLIAVHGAFAAGESVASLVGRTSPERAQSLGRTAAVTCVALLIVASTASLPRNWNTPKQDFEGAMIFASAEKAQEDVVAIADVTADMYGRYYGKDWRVLRSETDLATLRDSTPGRVLMVYTFPAYLALVDPALEARIERDCKTLRSFAGTLGGGDVTVCSFDKGDRQ